MGNAQRIGRYRLITQLGKGGMGEVYLAHDPELDRRVAVKVLHDEEAAQPEARELFRREARALAALSHPGIVTIFEIGSEDGRDFIAMEYLPGRTLRGELDAGGANRADVVAIASRVALALATAHTAGVLHRDVKPDNVMVMDDGAVKVVDFGIARRLEDSAPEPPAPAGGPLERARDLADVFARTLPVGSAAPPTSADEITTEAETLFGTPAYMAPELLAGRRSSEKGDVYALGVLLYECLSGELPFRCETLVETLHMIMDGEVRPERLDRMADPVDRALADLIDEMLAHDPDERPEMMEVAARLAATVSASGDSRFAPSMPRARPIGAPRRNRWLMAAGVVAVAGAAVGIAALSREPAATAPERAATTRSADPFPVALTPFRIEISSFAHSRPTSDGIGVVFGRLLERVDGIELVSVEALRGHLGDATTDDDVWERTALALGAPFLVRGTVIEREDGGLSGVVELHDLTDRNRVVRIEREAPVTSLSVLLAELAEGVARALVPDAVVTPSESVRSLESLKNYDAGQEALLRRDWPAAVLYLEAATRDAPSFFDAWYHLALAHAWALTTPARALEAIDRAIELAPNERDRAIAGGIALFLRGDFAGARATLEPLAERHPRNRDLLYFLAEAEWHDGDHERAIARFEATLDVAPKFTLAAIHPGEYHRGRRDEAEARRFYSIQGRRDAPRIDFAAGRYEELLSSTNRAQALAAAIVLERSDLIPALEPKEGTLARSISLLAREAAAENTEGARRHFESAWQLVETSAGQWQLEMSIAELGEVLLVAEMLDEVRTLLRYFEEHPLLIPSQAQQNLSVFGSPLLGDRRLTELPHLPARLQRAAEAMQAELDGDPARAATLLAPIVDSPTGSWDYPARAALIRNLDRAGRADELARRCAEIDRPAIFRWAMLPLRATCRRLGAQGAAGDPGAE